MSGTELREVIKRQPFEPFTVHLNDGSRLRVTQPDNILLPPAWKFSAIIALDNGRFSIIALRNISHVASRGRWPKVDGPKRRRNGGPTAEE